MKYDVYSKVTGAMWDIVEAPSSEEALTQWLESVRYRIALGSLPEMCKHLIHEPHAEPIVAVRPHASQEPEWLSGKHQWRIADWDCPTQCCACDLKREWVPALQDYSYVVDGEAEQVPPPCIPRLDYPIKGLLSSRQAAFLLGIRESTFFNYTNTLNLRPAAILTKSNTYLWRPNQANRLRKHLETHGRRKAHRHHEP